MGNDPKSIYNQNGQKSYGPSSMLQSKVSDNMGSAQEVSSVGLTASQDILQIAENIFNNAKADLQPMINQLETDLKKFLDSFQLLTTDPGKFITTSFSDFASLLEGVGETILQAFALILKEFIGNLSALLDTIITKIQAPIHIPVVSDLWNAIFGSSMSYLDLCCWIIAVPTSIISRAASSTTRTASSVGAVSGQAIALCMGTVVGAAIDGVDDFKNVNANRFPAIMDLTFSIINLGFRFPSDLLRTTSHSTLIMLSPQFLPF